MRRVTVFLTALFLLLPGPGRPAYPGADTIKAKMGNIREKPSIHARIIRRVHRGQRLCIRRAEGKWFYVELSDGTRGWAHRVLFKIPGRPGPSAPGGAKIGAGTPAVPNSSGPLSPERKRLQEIRSIQTVVYSETEEKVIFTLSGFFPPKTSTISGDDPVVVCEFAGIQPAAGISETMHAQGTLIRKIQTVANGKGTRVSVFLSPDYDYHIEQVFFEAERVYSLSIRKL